MKHKITEEECEFNRSIAGWIRERRKISGLSQTQVAEELGVGRNTVVRWEQGEPVSFWEFTRMCRLFGKQVTVTTSDVQPELLQRVA